MDNSKYTSAMKNADALTFSRSRFGRHYIKRLQRAHDEALTIIKDREFSKDYRDYAGAVLSTVDKELDYFERHKEFAKENSVFSRLLKKKEKPIEI